MAPPDDPIKKSETPSPLISSIRARPLPKLGTHCQPGPVELRIPQTYAGYGETALQKET